MEIPLDLTYAKSVHEFRKRLLEDLKNVKLTELKDGFPHEQIIPRATYAPWRADIKFIEFYTKIQNSTLIDIYRLYELYILSKSVVVNRGDFLEVGVWKGGSAVLLGASCNLLKECKLWLADTFSGVPISTSPYDTIYQGGEHADASVEQVQSLLSKCNIQNYQILKGLFPSETAASLTSDAFRFVHIDVDTYESADQVFSWIWPRVVPGGVVVFDDYGIWGCEGIVAYVDELRKKGLLVIHNLNGHAIVPKCS